MEPDFESAVVLVTFIGEDLPKELKNLATYLETNPHIQDYDSPMAVNISYRDSKWYVSMQADYWNEPKVVKMIKNKRIRGK